MWHYKEPRREDYETEAEYEEALAYYESALDDYEEDYIFRRREEG